MKKDTHDISLPITLEEFVKLTDLLFSKDEECQILAKEFFKEFATVTKSNIYLTDEF